MNIFMSMTPRNLIRVFVETLRGQHRSPVDETRLMVVVALRDELIRYRKALEVIADGGTDGRTVARWALRREDSRHART